jgi:ABC-type nickel/cobalt efflux system permease component RcnA
VRTRRVQLAAAVGVGLAVLVNGGAAGAHPLGNFTTNTHARIDVGANTVTVDFVLDLAEIPALQVTQRYDDDGDGVDDREAEAYRREQCQDIADGIGLELDDATLALVPTSSTLSFPPGQAGLDTLRLECQLVAAVDDLGRRAALRYRDQNFEDRVGWREVVAVASGATLVASDVPSLSSSDALRSYPTDRLASPLDQRHATLTVQPGPSSTEGTGSAPSPDGVERGSDRFSRAFTSLVASQNLNLAFGFVAVLGAVALGAVHALAPGHGKTVMAAYLVSSRGTSRLALLLGATVAVTHTLAVLVLGVIVSASETVAPERAYPTLGVVSGLLFSAVGAALLTRALRSRRDRRRRTSGTEHGAGHHHHGDDGDHGHGHEHALPSGPGEMRWQSILLPGLAGGLVPSPSALLVFLGGIALGRAWFGVLLVVAYGAGIAATLLAAGHLLVRARNRMERGGRQGRWSRVERVTVALPLITSTLIVVGGLAIAFRAVQAA